MNVSEELIREIVQKVLAEAKQQESGEDFVKEKTQVVLSRLRQKLSNASVLSRTVWH